MTMINLFMASAIVMKEITLSWRRQHKDTLIQKHEYNYFGFFRNQPKLFQMKRKQKDGRMWWCWSTLRSHQFKRKEKWKTFKICLEKLLADQNPSRAWNFFLLLLHFPQTSVVFFPFSSWHIRRKIMKMLLSVSFLLFKIDNVEMIKCRYATTKQSSVWKQRRRREREREREREKKNHPLFWLMPSCQLREFLYIFDTVLRDTFCLLLLCKTFSNRRGDCL